MSSTTIALFAVAISAFATEGAIGFGGTVIAACIGAQLVPLDTLIPAFVVLNLVLSASIAVRGTDVIAWRFLVRDIAPPVAVGTIAGIVTFRLAEASGLAIAFGGFVVALAVLQLVRPADRALPGPARIALLVLGGIAHGMFGTGGPMIVYVARRELPDKRAFRATLAILWLGLNLALLASFLAAGLYTTETRDTGVVLAVAIVPGLALGELVHRRLAPERFERVVWLLLLVAGSALVVRSI
jgi:hypothetical protein